ncbi:hypothetical protein B0H11DRAFT_2297241 [Mycena galericulata]|nr:hypothetical protein B0H11DRAFT_2297241 [Mycena galericulata]
MSPTSSDKIVYLISGANRGIGYSLAAAIAARLNTIVFAGARDPAAQSLKDLAAKHSNVHPVKLTSGDQADNEAAIAEIQKTAGRLDVIIANAAISNYYGTLATTPLSQFKDHWECLIPPRSALHTEGPARKLVAHYASHTAWLRALAAHVPQTRIRASRYVGG